MSFAKGQDLLRLAMMATRRRGVSLMEIEEEFACSERTAQRMTDALQAAFPQTERRVDEDRRARWLIPARAIAPLLTPSADELVALAEAIAQLDMAGLRKEAAHARGLERKVRALIPPEQGTRLDVDTEAVLEALGHAARPGPRPAADEGVVEAIYEALKGPNLLRIMYRRRDEDEPHERVVAPHGLLLGVRRYLVARDTAKGPQANLRHYRVEEIQRADLLDGMCEIDPGFSLKRHAEKGFGSYESADEFGEVVWRFTSDAAAHARRFVFHPTQTTEEMADGSLIVRFMASGHLEMTWHLYAWGDAVEVIAPLALREMVEGHRRRFPALP
ncbi:transcriptional regulator [Sphingomonas sp. Leaf24]|jgi:predicted DNA-binding transcriptional regulator YafY|uniref:helix-turn-helix transcriptional regulator n=1 Tax=Sphingomonas TaxID=13687 RepID=UPI0006F590B1|nr:MULTISPECIES: WYL domain-containing protein [Sphingomonas]KQM20048.1 transcriptional regulator [Sphingomonas sp. Leaf5]KQM90826.1 transcriptional regulator [Sphingomonas sp. Leaf24]KQM94093.1 transcriptional regulator [Sphingomonas sp. Leaf22]